MRFETSREDKEQIFDHLTSLKDDDDIRVTIEDISLIRTAKKIHQMN